MEITHSSANAKELRHLWGGGKFVYLKLIIANGIFNDWQVCEPIWWLRIIYIRHCDSFHKSVYILRDVVWESYPARKRYAQEFSVQRLIELICHINKHHWCTFKWTVVFLECSLKNLKKQLSFWLFAVSACIRSDGCAVLTRQMFAFFCRSNSR